MLANIFVTSEVVRPRVDAMRVAILMCTKNGAKFLAQQLKSIADQTHTNWTLFVSDDGSSDETVDIVARFAREFSQRVVSRLGPGKGVCANFLSLATDPSIDADYFAFSDQDDIWHKNKLERAINWLATVPDQIPGMYCGRTELVTADGQSYGLSPLFTRAPAFQNALVQSLGGGNTMVFNRAAKKMLEDAGRIEVVLHDWWLYQLVSAAGGAIHYDPQPTIKYRQHPNSLIGSNLGWRARIVRIRMTFSGRFRDWNRTNIAALERVPPHLIAPQNRSILKLFAQARTATLFKRLVYFKQSGVYRQTLLGNIGLFVAAIIKRI
jgi:glycosyltransferase involved in cell wall biosynthesis